VPDHVDAAGVDNLIRLNADLFSGGQPKDEEAYRALAQLGIKTIISVDGARPDEASAAKFGMQTIHLPIGYSRIPRKSLDSIIKAVEVSPKPVYVHCHHGRHRGPAAAAAAARGLYDWSADVAKVWMIHAGTSPHYKGLYQSVEELRVPDKAALSRMPTTFTAFVEAEPMVRIMADIDRRWDTIKLIRAADWSRSLPDLSPGKESIELLELFKELQRVEQADDYPQDLRRRLASAEEDLQALHDELVRPGRSGEEERLFQAVKESCRSCHHRYRD
jgi:protein tyrosine phosphatase (PTP) superfamily phosphohydrolase (DUF442 family)